MRTPSRPALISAAVIAVGLVLLPATAASAHDDLVSANPAPDSSIDADPGTVSVQFSETLLALGDSTDGFAVQVVDPEGLHYESGCVTIQDAQATTPVALGDAGGYVVLWQVVSSDGHPTSGQFEFDYEPASLDGAADGLTNAPACGDPWAGAPDGTSTPTATATAEPVETPEPTGSSSTAGAAAGSTDEATATPAPATGLAGALPVPVIVLIAVLGLGLIAALVVLALRRQRGGDLGGR